jgi:hypothetical protein
VSEYVRCVGCGEIVEATEPCSCLFDVVGTLDAQGVLHTAERTPVQFAVPCCCCEELFEPDPQQVDAWGQSGRRFEPTDWVCQACEAAGDAALERMCEVEERAWLETERAAEWAVQRFVSQRPCDDSDDYEVVEVIEFEIVEDDLADVGLGDEIGKDYVESYRRASQDLTWRTW